MKRSKAEADGAAPADRRHYRHRLKPSALASYFTMDCEKFLALEVEGRPLGSGGERAPTPAHQQAVLDRGNDFEDVLLDDIRARIGSGEAGQPLMGVRVKRLVECTDDKDSTERLHVAEAGDVLYQSCFSPPAGLPVEFTIFKPDYVVVAPRVDGGISLIIIDAKSSPAAKLSHKVQVALYVIFMRQIISAAKLDGTVSISDTGGVWLPNSEPVEFPLRLLVPELTRFVRESLPGILDKGSQKANWHFSHEACPMCPNAERCRTDAIRENSLSRLPYLAKRTRQQLERVLPGLLGMHAPGEEMKEGEEEELRPIDIEDLGKLMRVPVTGSVPDPGLALVRRVLRAPSNMQEHKLQQQEPGHGRDIGPVLQAIQTGKVHLQADTCASLPSSEDEAIFVTCLEDPTTQQAYAWAVTVVDRRIPSDPAASPPTHSGVVKAFHSGCVPVPKDGASPSAELFEDCHRQCVRALAGVFSCLENVGRLTFHSRPRVCIFFEDESQRKCLLRMLLSFATLGDGAADGGVAADAAKQAGQCVMQLLHEKNALEALSLTSALPDVAGVLPRTALNVPSKSALKTRGKAALQQLCTDRNLSAAGKVDELVERVMVSMYQQALDDDSEGGVDALAARYSEASKKAASLRAKQCIEMNKPRVAVLLPAMRDLLAIPVPGFYCFAEIITYLMDDAPDAPADNNTMYQAWRAGDGVVELLHYKLLHTVATLDALRRFVSRSTRGDVFIHEAGRFVRVPSVPASHWALAALAFVVQLDALDRCNKIVNERRLVPLAERARLGRALRLRYDGRDQFLLLDADSGALAQSAPGALEPDSFTMKKWILCKEEEVPRSSGTPLAALRVPDILYCTDAWFSGDGFGLDGGADILDVQHHARGPGGVPVIRVRLRRSNRAELAVGQTYVLLPRHVDILTKRVVESVLECDRAQASAQATPPLFMRLLLDPNAWGCERAPVCEVPQPIQHTYPLTQSQEQVFSRVMQRRLTIVWGPPGSGKTHLLASTLLRLAEISRAANKSLNVCVTAFTNSAVDNLLRKISKLRQGSKAIAEEGMTVCRLASAPWPDQQTSGVEWLDSKSPTALKKRLKSANIVVVGSTVWQLNKCLKNARQPTFQVMVIDEGSQFPLAHGCLALPHLDPNAGRLIVAGDHLQMAPITSFCFPVKTHSRTPRQQLPKLWGSLMEGLMWNHQGPVDVYADIDLGPCTLQLQDNFRMNRELCDFSGLALYGGKYQPRNPDATLFSAAARLEDAAPEDGGEQSVLQEVVRSQSSLCQLSLKVHPTVHARVGTMPSQDLAQVEAHAVAGLVRRFAVPLCEQYAAAMQAAKLRSETKAVTQPSIFVVTPHHVQRVAIEEHLRAIGVHTTSAASGDEEKDEKGHESSPTVIVQVDTVEKMQGRECDVAIVCYGYLDTAAVLAEGEFLLNRNRLNVSVTRARTKAVLVVAESLLQLPVMALQSSATEAGYSYLRTFAAQSQSFAYRVDEAQLNVTGDAVERLRTDLAAADQAINALAGLSLQ